MSDGLQDAGHVGDTVYVKEFAALGPGNHHAPPPDSPVDLASQASSRSADMSPQRTVPHHARRGTGGPVSRYERNERYLNQQWGGQGWYPPRQFMKDSACNTRRQRLNAIHVQYLASITRVAVDSGMHLPSLYQPGGALYEAMLAESHKCVPVWTTKTTKAAWRLINHHYIDLSRVASLVTDESVDNLGSGDDQSAVLDENTPTSGEVAVALEMLGNKNEGQGHSSGPAECQADKQPSELVSTAADELTGIRVDYDRQVQEALTELDHTLEKLYEVYRRNLTSRNKVLQMVGSCDAAGADRLSKTEQLKIGLFERHRLEIRDAVFIIKRQAPARFTSPSPFEIDTASPSSDLSHIGYGPCHRVEDNESVPGPLAKSPDADNVLAMLNALEGHCSQNPPRPDILHRRLEEYRDRRAKVTTATTKAQAAKASAEQALAKASSRLDKTIQAINDTNATLDGLSLPPACSSPSGLNSDDDLDVTTADEIIAELWARQASVRFANRKAADRARLDRQEAEEAFANADAEVAKLNTECGLLDGSFLEIQRDIEVNGAWLRLLKKALG